MGLTARDLVVTLLDYRGTAEVEATTPHGTYNFEIVAVEGNAATGPVLRLVEVPAVDPEWHSQMGLQ